MTVLIVIFYMNITVNSVASITMQEFRSPAKCEAAKAFVDSTVGAKSLRVWSTCLPK